MREYGLVSWLPTVQASGIARTIRIGGFQDLIGFLGDVGRAYDLGVSGYVQRVVAGSAE